MYESNIKKELKEKYQDGNALAIQTGIVMLIATYFSWYLARYILLHYFNIVV